MSWLKSQRERVGIKSQEELANRLQLEGLEFTRSAVSQWENETRPLPVRNKVFIKALSKILRMSEVEILRSYGYELEGFHTPIGERAAFLMEQIPEDKQELAIRMLELFVDP